MIVYCPVPNKFVAEVIPLIHSQAYSQYRMLFVFKPVSPRVFINVRIITNPILDVNSVNHRTLYKYIIFIISSSVKRVCSIVSFGPNTPADRNVFKSNGKPIIVHPANTMPSPKKYAQSIALDMMYVIL